MSRPFRATSVADWRERCAAGAAIKDGVTMKSAAVSALVRPLEGDVQPAVLEALELHPKVAWVRRVNTGGVEKEKEDGTKRYLKFGWTGQLDITGQLVDGRRLDVEVKRPGKGATPDQQATINTVNRNGGVAFVAHSADEVFEQLSVV